METRSELQLFTQLVTDYREPFIRFAHSYTRHTGVAEDFVMEALLYYWEHRNDLQPDSNVPAYILAIIKHKCLNYLQHIRVQEQVTEELRELHEWELYTRIISLQACDPQELFTQETQAIVDKCISLMPEQTRRVFLMSRYENLSHKEIAHQLGITPKGVEFHITKALKILRLHLKDYFPLMVLLTVT